jgi:hypothetical protein
VLSSSLAAATWLLTTARVVLGAVASINALAGKTAPGVTVESQAVLISLVCSLLSCCAAQPANKELAGKQELV